MLSVPTDMRRVHGCARRSVPGTLGRVCTPGRASPAALRQEPPGGQFQHVCVGACAVIGGHEVVADHE